MIVGTFTHPITLISPNGDRTETLDGLVDTGATFSSAPAHLLTGLGVSPQRTIRLRPADGRIVQHEVGELLAELEGVTATVICIFAPEDSPVLIGAHTLVAFLLAVDPVEQRLVPVDAPLAFGHASLGTFAFEVDHGKDKR